MNGYQAGHAMHADATKTENEKRQTLKREKPLVFAKILKIDERFDAGLPTPVVDICYDRICNLH
jgi:hypothetical protein